MKALLEIYLRAAGVALARIKTFFCKNAAIYKIFHLSKRKFGGLGAL